MNRILFLFCFCFCVMPMHAQLPLSNIYLFDFTLDADSLFIDKAQFLSNFNSDGYNNQPYFLAKDKLLISSNYLQPEQTDIFLLDIRKKQILQVTDTDQSEYSPTPAPDGTHFSVIRVEPSLDNAQFLWKYPLNRKNGGNYLFKELNTIGYHCWLNNLDIALFLVNNPFHKLVMGNIETQKTQVLMDNIGRTLIQNSDGNLLFVHKISNKFWYIKSYNPKTHQFEIVCRTLDQKEDFAMMDDGSFLMGSGSKLFHLNPAKESTWTEVCDFIDFGIENISRLKVQKNQLALVSIQAN